MLKKLWKEYLIFALGISLLVACNGNDPFARQSDPLESYADLKGDVPQKELQPEQREQQAIVKPFDVHVVGDDVTRLNFVAGKEARHEVSARVFEEASYTLQIKGEAPKDLELVEKDPEKGLWEIVWKPSEDLISPNDDDGVEIPLEVELVITQASESVKAKFDALEKVFQYTLAVSKTIESPVIVGSEELDKIRTVKEDANISFSLIVEDPASTNVAPKVLIDSELSSSSQEQKIYYAGNALMKHPSKSTENLGKGRWKSHWIFNAKFPASVNEENKKDGKITVEFRMQIQSLVTGRSSVGWTKQLNIEFNPEVVASEEEEVKTGDPQ